MGTYPTQIVVAKSIPVSSWYSGSGATSITVNATDVQVNTKRTLIKINQPQSNSTQASNPTDKSKSYIYDLKRVEDTIRVTGWLADDASETAWNKAWKLRAMCSSGNVVTTGTSDKGALTSLTLDNVVFSSATQRAFLETITFTTKPSGAVNNLTDNAGVSVARVEVDLAFYVGDPK
jgi:hypothetical protein